MQQSKMSVNSRQLQKKKKIKKFHQVNEVPNNIFDLKISRFKNHNFPIKREITKLELNGIGFQIAY